MNQCDFRKKQGNLWGIKRQVIMQVFYSKIRKQLYLCLDVHLPAAPVTGKWVTEVPVGHHSDELWHWAVNLHCLAENSLCTESLVGCHTKGRPKPLTIKKIKRSCLCVIGFVKKVTSQFKLSKVYTIW